jgi:hypothetical protein
MEKRNSSKRLIALLCFCLPILCFSRQTVLDKKISIQVHNETIVTVLHRIEKQASVTFMYMSGLFDKNKQLSFSYTNTSIKVILQKMLSSNVIMLYVVDNKIIFYKKDEAAPGKEGISYSLTMVETPISASVEIQKPAPEIHKKSFDTIKVTIHDTVIITIHDTIKIQERPKSIEAPILSKGAVSQTQRSSLSTTFLISAWGSIGLAKEAIPTINSSVFATTLTQSEKSQTTRIDYGIGLHYCFTHFSIATGIGYATKSWVADYNFQKIYTDYSQVVGYTNVVNWIVTPRIPNGPPFGGQPQFDSVKVITHNPIYKNDTIHTKYQGNNTASYISIPLLFSFINPLYKNLTLIAGTGITLHLLRKALGYTIKDSSNVFVPLTDILKDYYLTSNSQAGLQYSLGKHQVVSI